MISVFSPTTEDFSTIGLATLQPTECIVEEKAGGLFELSMKHPIDDDLKWTYLQNGCILKVPCAMREAPIVRILDAVPSGTTETKTRKIYKVSTPQGGRLRLRAKASTSSKILHAYKPGTKVVQLKTSGSWSKVSVCNGGATGWMWTAYLAFVKNETETVSGSVEKQSVIIGTQQTREQLFRIYSVAPSAETGLVEVKASHIFYDLSGVICTKDYAPENVAANTVLDTVLANLSAEQEFEFHCTVETKISGTYTGVSLVKALLDPEIGIVAQTGARIIRDNFDVYILPDETTERGMEIRHRKNLLGATLTTDVSSAVTRIRPVGKDKNGNRLLITDNSGWVESANKGLYPTQRDVEIEYDVAVSTASDAEYKTNAAARAKLKELAEADFANGADAATVSLDVQFAALENTREYADYASMLTLFLYDTVKVVAAYAGISAKLRVNGYTYNCLLKRYDEIQCGELTDVEQTVYGYEIASGSVSGTKLLPNSVNANTVMRNATIGYAKIAQATIEQLCADSIVAIRAHINELVAGSVTTDQLYADLAIIAAAQITSANIEKANIDWASIATLTAQIATIAKAQITTANIKDANIQWAEIATLTAKMAEIAQAKIDDAEITTAQIKDLEATIATIAAAKIGDADIGFAQIKDLVSGTAIITEGVGGKLYISRLAVTEANMVSLTVGELIVKGSDGSFYAVSVDEDGNIKTTLKQIANADVEDSSINAGEKIIEGSITAACLNAQEIFADSAIIRQLIAANMDVATLFAQEAFISHLNTADISGNQYLKLAVKDAVDAVEMKITPEAITATVKENIDLGGRNLLRDTRAFGASGTANYTFGGTLTEDAYDGFASRHGSSSAQTTLMQYSKSDWARGDDYMLSFWAKGSGFLGAVMTTYSAPCSSVVSNGQTGTDDGGSVKIPMPSEWTRYWIRFTMGDWGEATAGKILILTAEANSTAYVCGVKLEKGSVATDWTPAPEDAESEIGALETRVSAAEVKITPEAIVATVEENYVADQLHVDSSYSKVDINKDRVRIVSTQMEVAVPSEDGEDDVMRVDADGVHADVVDADEIISDSVLNMAPSASYTPADAGALAEILEDLKGKCIDGTIYIYTQNVTGGDFEISNIYGNGLIQISNTGTFNSLTIKNCSCLVHVYAKTFSTAGTAVTVSNSRLVSFASCTFNAGVGLEVGGGWKSEVKVNDCEGDCTKLASVSNGSILRIWGSTKPSGTYSLQNGGEIYNNTSDPTFAEASSSTIPTTTTATVSLSPTSTSTSGHSGLGTKLYQGRYTSSQSFRKGIMLFTLPTDLTSADSIDSATLTLKRISGVGGGGSVTAQIRCYDATGTLYASKSFLNGQTASIDVTSAVKAMITSGYTGLMLYNPDTTTVGSKTYTTGYARFAGLGESGAPVLKVSYRK